MKDEEITKEIQRLRDGGAMNEQGAKAIALGISRKFDELADAWAKRFSIGGWVDLPTAAPTRLHFCKRRSTKKVTGGFKFAEEAWAFVIVYKHEQEELRISEANLELRTAAARALPALEKVLAENENADRVELLESYDTISRLAEEAKLKRQSENNR